MDAVIALARAELRRSWRGLLVIGLVAGLVGGGGLAALAGARRTDSAFDRLVERTNFWDLEVTLFDPGDGVIDDVLALPGVERATRSNLSVGRDLRDPAKVSFIAVVNSADDPLIDRIVVEGRAADPRAVDEVVVSKRFAEAAGLQVGDTVPWSALSHDQFVRIDEVGDEVPAGPRVDFRIVGLTLDPSDLVLADTSAIVATPAFAQSFGADLPRVRTIQLAVDDAADPHEVGDEALAIAEANAPDPEGNPFPAASVHLLDEARPAIEEATNLPSDGLRVLAGSTAAVAVLALLQAAARQLGAARVATARVRALGVTRAQRAAALAAVGGPAALLAAVVAPIIAVAASGWTPIGAARRAEPDPGLFVDVIVVGLGSLVVGLAVAAAFAVNALAISRRAAAGAEPGAAGTAAPTWLGLHPVAGIGARLALDGRGVVPVRSAMAGVALGALTVCGGLVFGGSLDRLDEPNRYGHADLSVEAPDDAVVARLDRHDGVVGTTLVQTAEVELNGVPVAGFGYGPLESRLGFSLLEGRHAATDAEVVLGPRLLDRLGLDVGDLVQATPRDGSEPVPLRVVGSGLGPEDLFGSFADLAAFTTEGHDRVRQSETFETLHVDLADGVTAANFDRELNGFEVYASDPPSAVTNLAALDRMPTILVGLGFVVALTAVAHAAVLTGRHRRRELVTARALGYTSRQVSAAVVVAAGVIAGVGLVIGMPVGLALGGRLWAAAADATYLAADVATPWLLALVAPALLAGALAVALVPARRAGRAPVSALR